jgi:hypothetical protein
MRFLLLIVPPRILGFDCVCIEHQAATAFASCFTYSATRHLLIAYSLPPQHLPRYYHETTYLFNSLSTKYSKVIRNYACCAFAPNPYLAHWVPWRLLITMYGEGYKYHSENMYKVIRGNQAREHQYKSADVLRRTATTVERWNTIFPNWKRADMSGYTRARSTKAIRHTHCIATALTSARSPSCWDSVCSVRGPPQARYNNGEPYLRNASVAGCRNGEGTWCCYSSTATDACASGCMCSHLSLTPSCCL